MESEVRQRIDQIQRGEVPRGYKKTKAGILPIDWTIYLIKDCLERVERPVSVQADEMYTQIGIRSHGKGLFYKEPVSGESLGKKAVFWIEPDCFILNIVFAWEQAIGKTTQNEVGMIGSHRFPMYRSVDGKIDIDYLIEFLMTKRGKDILEAASPGGAGRNRTLGQDRFMKSKIILPTKPEQQKIAEIIKLQEQVIELNSQMIMQLELLKKACLRKMFPEQGSNVPEVRFPGFTDSWERRKFKDTFDGLQNNTVSRAELNYENGTAKNIHYGDVLIKFGGYIDASNTVLPYFNDESIVLKFEASLLQDGDIIIVDTAEDTTVGKCTEIQGSEGMQLVSGLHTIPCRPKEKYAPKFMGYYMNSSSYHGQLIPLMQGTKVTSISRSALQETELLIPKSFKEQEKVGAYFSEIDALITLHQRKLKEEKQKKKALMQLLFSGIVRVTI